MASRWDRLCPVDSRTEALQPGASRDTPASSPHLRSDRARRVQRPARHARQARRRPGHDRCGALREGEHMTHARVGVKGSNRMQKGPQRGSCGPFAVPSAGNSREQARTADHEPQRFREFSRMFPAVPSFGVYRGDRGWRAWVRALWPSVGGFVGRAGTMAPAPRSRRCAVDAPASLDPGLRAPADGGTARTSSWFHDSASTNRARRPDRQRSPGVDAR